jgi:hypothetical protein
LERPRYGRRPKSSDGDNRGVAVIGHRQGHRSRSLMGTFGRIEIEVPRAAERTRRQNHGVEQPGVAGLSASHAGGRCATAPAPIGDRFDIRRAAAHRRKSCHSSILIFFRRTEAKALLSI